jgi:dUTP pyrophosphatase
MVRNTGTRVEVKVLDPRLLVWGLPRYQTAMAAGVDLFACCVMAVVLAPGSPAALIPCGLAIHIADPLLAAVIVPRSGMGHKKGLVLGNLIGVIDADYTGPVLISAWNRNGPGTEPIVIEPGDRIAQMVIVPIVRPTFEIVNEFSAATPRGDGGFGSTGAGTPV